MPGVRLNRVLASTAVVLLLSAGGGRAEPKYGTDIDAAPPVVRAPETARPAAPPAAIAAPADTAIPQAAADQPGTDARANETSGKPDAAPADAVTEPDAEDGQAATAAAPATPDRPDASSPQPPTAGAPDATAASPPASSEAERSSAGATPSTPTATTPATAQTAPQPPASTTAPQPATAAAPTAPAQPAAASSGGDEVPSIVTRAPPAATPSAPAAASPVVDANAAVAEQLRALADGKFDRVIGGKKERAAIESFYSGRNYAPLWITDGKANARGKAAVAYLGQVDTDGLDPADYPVPDFASISDPAALAEAELRLTSSVVRYVHHAQVGRVHWSRVSADIYYDQKPSNPAEVLANLAGASDIGAALAAYEPQNPAYVALKAKLAELRAGKQDAGEAPMIPNGPPLKVGMQDERVPLLRERLRVGGDGPYDKALAEAVKKFQQEHEIKPTGTLTAATVQALNGRRPDRPIDTVIANLERWRWMPHDLGKNYVIVNLPDFTLRVFHDGHQVWKTKIVDGKPNMPTPIMSAEMKYITVNPTWNVPPSIVAKEYMPVLEQDPTALERIGLTVTTNPDGTVHISQPPGDRNALGRLRFNFPNKFLVYQHDTPEKYLFAYDRRAFSHGCMRVQDPVKYAEVLLSIVRPRDGYTQERIRRMFGDNELDIQFPTYIPVHLTYQTAFVDEEGKLEFRDDVYGRDKALLAIMKSDERKVADIPIERRDNPIRREQLAMPEQSFGRFGPGNFFSRVFGGSAFLQPPPPPSRHSAQRPMEIR